MFQAAYSRSILNVSFPSRTTQFCDVFCSVILVRNANIIMVMIMMVVIIIINIVIFLVVILIIVIIVLSVTKLQSTSYISEV